MASSKSVTSVVSVVVAATVVVSTVAYFNLTSGNGEKNTATAKQPTTIKTSNDPLPISVVPEANPGLVMLPFFGAVLLFSSRNLLRPKTAKKTAL
jgi:hypothetical protein